MDPSIAVFCNDNPEIPGDLGWAEAYFARMTQASDWADVWAGFLIACQCVLISLTLNRVVEGSLIEAGLNSRKLISGVC
jgi:hypothetical protein